MAGHQGRETAREVILERIGVAAASREVDRLAALLAGGDLDAVDGHATALERWLALGGDDAEPRLEAAAAEAGLERRAAGSPAGVAVGRPGGPGGAGRAAHRALRRAAPGRAHQPPGRRGAGVPVAGAGRGRRRGGAGLARPRRAGRLRRRAGGAGRAHRPRHPLRRRLGRVRARARRGPRARAGRVRARGRPGAPRSRRPSARCAAAPRPARATAPRSAGTATSTGASG